MKKLLIVLLSVDFYDRKRHAEALENQSYKDEIAVLNEIEKIAEHKVELFIYEPSDFMDACNNQEVELEQFWITYVWVEDKSDLTNITVNHVELSCELAHNSAKDEMVAAGTINEEDEMWINSDHADYDPQMQSYTEEAQDIFNRWYDYYYEIIEQCKS